MLFETRLFEKIVFARAPDRVISSSENLHELLAAEAGVELGVRALRDVRVHEQQVEAPQRELCLHRYSIRNGRKYYKQSWRNMP